MPLHLFRILSKFNGFDDLDDSEVQQAEEACLNLCSQHVAQDFEFALPSASLVAELAGDLLASADGQVGGQVQEVKQRAAPQRAQSGLESHLTLLALAWSVLMLIRLEQPVLSAFDDIEETIVHLLELLRQQV